MVDSVNAASRVGALLLSVVVFAAMWESDSPAESQEHWLVSRVSREQIDTAAEPPQSYDRQTELNSLLTMSMSGSQLSMVSAVNAAGTSTSLPSGIAPGRYRVVDSDGAVESIFVSEAMTGTAGSTQPRDFYTLRLDTRTRYFIRVKSAVATVASTKAGDVR